MWAFPLARGAGTSAVPPACLLTLLIWATGPPVAAQDYVASFGQEPPRFAGTTLDEPLGSDSWAPPAATPPAARPGLTERIRGLARGRTQLECGYAFLSDSAEGVRMRQHAVPDLLLRFGLTERLEIRLGWPGYVATDYAGPGIDESIDDTLEPNVGFMFDLWGQRGILPQTAVLAAVPIAMDGNPFTQESLQPLAQLLYRWQLTDRTALGGTTGTALFDVAGDGFIQLQQTISLDHLVTRRMGIFGEWEMLVDRGSADDRSQHLLGGGVSYLVTDRVQLTWKAGLGLNAAAPDFLTHVRLAYRF